MTVDLSSWDLKFGIGFRFALGRLKLNEIQEKSKHHLLSTLRDSGAHVKAVEPEGVSLNARKNSVNPRTLALTLFSRYCRR